MWMENFKHPSSIIIQIIHTLSANDQWLTIKGTQAPNPRLGDSWTHCVDTEAPKSLHNFG